MLGLQVAKALYVSSFHATVLGLQDVVGRIANAKLTGRILDLAAALDMLSVETIWLSANLLLRMSGLLGASLPGDL